MDRLYPPLASISRAADSIIALQLFNTVYFLILLIAINVIMNRLATL